MSVRTVQLGEVCEINPATDFDLRDNSLCTFVPMEAVDEWSAQILRPATRPFRKVSKGYTPFAENDVLLAKITPCMENGKCAIARGLRDGVGFGSTEFHVLRASKHVLPEWLLYFWRLPETRQSAERSMTGTAGQKRVPSAYLETARLPLPELSEQKRITGLLQQTDRLRRTRRYAVELSDTFLPAVFLKLFGECFARGPFDELGNLVTITGGGTPTRDRPEFFQGRIPWLTSKDMRGDYIWDTEEHINDEAIRNSATNLIPANSILVVVKSKVLMHRLPIAIAKVPMCHGQDIKSIQCSTELHYEFARFVLKFHERRLLNIARGANTEGLTLPMLEELPIPKINYAKQQKFAALVERHGRVRIIQRSALRQADHLFRSLLHGAFTAPDELGRSARPATTFPNCRPSGLSLR